MFNDAPITTTPPTNQNTPNVKGPSTNQNTLSLLVTVPPGFQDGISHRGGVADATKDI